MCSSDLEIVELIDLTPDIVHSAADLADLMIQAVEHGLCPAKLLALFVHRSRDIFHGVNRRVGIGDQHRDDPCDAAGRLRGLIRKLSDPWLVDRCIWSLRAL